MNAMPDETKTRSPGQVPQWTWQKTLYATVLAIAGAAITAIAFWIIYLTVTAATRPYLHQWDWTPVAAGEIVFLFMYGTGVLLAWHKVPDIWWRPLAMTAVIAGSFILNIWTARGVVLDMVAHVVVTGAFFVVVLLSKAVVSRIRGGKIRPDRVSLGEWLASPARAAALTYWMLVWGEPSRAAANERYMRLQYARAVAQDTLGTGRERGWMRQLPVTLRYQIGSGMLPAFPGDDWQAAVGDHVRHAIGHASPGATTTASAPPERPPGTTPEGRQKARQPTASLRARNNARARSLLTASPGMPIEEVARRAGVSERTVSRIKSQMPRLQAVP